MEPAERRVKAMAVAVRLLAGRERSALEVRQRLRQRGFDAETIAGVVEELQEKGLQDDARFADAFAESAGARGLASRAIQGELRRRGVGKDLAASAAADPPEAEEARARAVAERRAPRLATLPPDVRYRRLSTFLTRRGYPQDVCQKLAAEFSRPDFSRPDKDNHAQEPTFRRAHPRTPRRSRVESRPQRSGPAKRDRGAGPTEARGGAGPAGSAPVGRSAPGDPAGG